VAGAFLRSQALAAQATRRHWLPIHGLGSDCWDGNP
jgi:hypothetical protein